MKENTGPGKGDAPRNLGPKFRANYDAIDWRRKPRAKKSKRCKCDACRITYQTNEA